MTLKQTLCNIRRSQGRGRTRSLKFVLKGYLSVFYLYSTWRTRFWDFFPEFSSPGSGTGVRRSNFKFHPDTPKPISDCSVPRAESIGANISRIWPSYHKLRLKQYKKHGSSGKMRFVCSYRYERGLRIITKIIPDILAKRWYQIWPELGRIT